MILIIGSNHDDVLYFESILKNPREEVILNKHKLVIGSLSSMDVIVIQDIYTSYVSSLVTSFICSKYDISMIINVGRCEIARGNLQIGDIAICDSAFFGDVDQLSAVKGTVLGQIPNYPQLFTTDLEAVATLSKCLERVFDGEYALATIVSSSFFRQNKEMVRNIMENEYVQSLNKNVVIDGECSGIALASYLHKVPFVSIKVCEANVGEYTSLENYILALDLYSNIGKAVTAFINEISRKDVKRIMEE